MKNYSHFEYKKSNSFAHRLPPEIKLIFLLVFSIAAFLTPLKILVFIPLFVLISACLAGINPKHLLNGSIKLLFLLFAIFAFGSIKLKYGINNFQFVFEFDNYINNAVFCLRIISAFIVSSLFFHICPLREIKKVLSLLESFFGLKKIHAALSLSIMFNFIPRFFSVWEETGLAWKSRSGKTGLLGIVKILPLVIQNLMYKAAETAEALESRGAGS